MALLLAILLQASDVTAVRAGRVIPVSGPDLEGATILIQGGKIADVGPHDKVAVPEGARRLEAAVVMPGLVHANASFGLVAPGGTAAVKAADVLNPLDETFFAAARSGFTTLAIHPSGAPVAGRIVVVKARPGPAASMIVLQDGALRLSFTPSTASKDELRKALKGAKDQIETQKKPPAKPKEPSEAETAWQEAYKGDRRLAIQVSSAGALLHLWQVLDEFKDAPLKIAYLLPSDLYRVADALGTRKAEGIVDSASALMPNTSERFCPAALLHRRQCRFAFAPGDPEGALLEAARLVKFGVPREAALQALTLAPAAMSGVEARVGSIAKGKDADLLLLNGDPLSAGVRIERVLIDGRVAWEEAP